MNKSPYDPRCIANLMLDEAGRIQVKISNLALQKLLYFAHGLFLIETKKPLVTGYFEAWQYGPVHPAVYKSFKSSENEPITFRAKAQNILTGASQPIPEPDDPTVTILVQKVLGSYGRLSIGRLVEISHAKGSPWDFIVDKSRTSVAFGLRIPDNVIIDRFRYHKVPINDVSKIGEPSEDTPFA